MLYCSMPVMLYCSMPVMLYCRVPVMLYCSMPVMLYCNVPVLPCADAGTLLLCLSCCIAVCQFCRVLTPVPFQSAKLLSVGLDDKDMSSLSLNVIKQDEVSTYLRYSKRRNN